MAEEGLRPICRRLRGARGPARQHRRPCRRSAYQRPSAAAAHRLRPDRGSAPASAGKPTGCRVRRPGRGFLCSTRRGFCRLPGPHLFLGAPALCWCARTIVLEHGVFVVGLAGEVLKHPFPHPGLRPATEPSVNVFPVTEAFREVTPRNSGTVAIEDRLDESAVVLSGDANMPDPPWQILDPLPLVVAQSISEHGSAFSKADSP